MAFHLNMCLKHQSFLVFWKFSLKKNNLHVEMIKFTDNKFHCRIRERRLGEIQKNGNKLKFDSMFYKNPKIYDYQLPHWTVEHCIENTCECINIVLYAVYIVQSGWLCLLWEQATYVQNNAHETRIWTHKLLCVERVLLLLLLL